MVGLLTDFTLQMVFFVTVLSVDIRRMEVRLFYFSFIILHTTMSFSCNVEKQVVSQNILFFHQWYLIVSNLKNKYKNLCTVHSAEELKRLRSNIYQIFFQTEYLNSVYSTYAQVFKPSKTHLSKRSHYGNTLC